MKTMLRTVAWWLIDLVFPMAQPLSGKEKQASEERRSAAQCDWERRVAALKGDKASFSQYLELCKAALDDERQRQQSFDSRLTSIVGFASIAATVAFGPILTGLPQRSGVLSLLIFLLLGYIMLQLGSAIYAGIRGLDRRGYLVISLADMLPGGDEAETYFVRRQIEQYHAIFVQHQDQNNAKLTQVAVAYRAIKNFVAGLLIFAVLAGTYRAVRPQSDDLAGRLKSDRALRQLLQGSQGQPGPPGPAGAAGPMEPSCVSVPSTSAAPLGNAGPNR
jgi:hypothetical protein